MAKKYKVVGPRVVAGAKPGERVELDLPADNIAALVASGHIEAVPEPKPKAKATRKGDR